MGVVYLAREVRLDRLVALKVLPVELAANAEPRERFLSEARTAARLSHPHIVPIYAVHEIEHFVLFAMAYVAGETLGTRVRDKGPLPPRDAARILREVGWALAYAHGQGVVHRDVKPDNILLEAGSGRALVADFGIAQVSARSRSAEVGAILGTAEFMSPEQARGGVVDERSDLYSLGVVGHYMLSGRVPFRGSSPAETLALHVTAQRPPMAAVVPGLPVSLTRAIDRCLAKDPAERFASGEELANAVAQDLEPGRDVPVPLRLFMTQSRDSMPALAAFQILSLFGLAVAVGGLMDGVELLWVVLTAAGSLALASLPTAVVVRLTRRLMRSGYDHGDLVRAVRDEVGQAQAELMSVCGSERTALDRWLKRLLVGGLGSTLASFAWIMLGPYLPGLSPLAGLIMTGSSIVAGAAGAAAAVRHQLGGHVPGRSWLRFWESWMGRALFRASGLHLERLRAAAPYGPTEVAIGSAADRLFESLPTEQRRAFRDLPEVVKRLEADAARMRARVEDLDALAGQVEGHGGRSRALAGVSNRRGSLEAALRSAREAAETRLGEVVAALEMMRVDLLRLHAGAGSVESVTMDLSAARDLSRDVALMLEARRDVERLLGHAPALELGATPTPA